LRCHRRACGPPARGASARTRWTRGSAGQPIRPRGARARRSRQAWSEDDRALPSCRQTVRRELIAREHARFHFAGAGGGGAGETARQRDALAASQPAGVAIDQRDRTLVIDAHVAQRGATRRAGERARASESLFGRDVATRIVVEHLAVPQIRGAAARTHLAKCKPRVAAYRAYVHALEERRSQVAGGRERVEIRDRPLTAEQVERGERMPERAAGGAARIQPAQLAAGQILQQGQPAAHGRAGLIAKWRERLSNRSDATQALEA